MQVDALEVHQNERFLARLWHAPRGQGIWLKSLGRALKNGTPIYYSSRLKGETSLANCKKCGDDINAKAENQNPNLEKFRGVCAAAWTWPATCS
jgi:hypothetical protein